MNNTLNLIKIMKLCLGKRVMIDILNLISNDASLIEWLTIFYKMQVN